MWLRFCFKCSIVKEDSNKELDKAIIRKLWLPKSEILEPKITLRSKMVLKCINDFEKGKNYP